MIPLTTSASRSTMSDAEDVGKIVGRKDGAIAKKTKKPNQKMQAWIEARKRHHLSHAQIHMARELGMSRRIMLAQDVGRAFEARIRRAVLADSPQVFSTCAEYLDSNRVRLVQFRRGAVKADLKRNPVAR